MEENVNEKEEVVVEETAKVENNVEETVDTELLELAKDDNSFDPNAFVEASSFLDEQKDKPKEKFLNREGFSTHVPQSGGDRIYTEYILRARNSNDFM